jgi:elongator complex protein 2
VGHAYGGSIHVWHLDDTALRATKASSAESMAAEDRAAMVQWRAQPCVTGHFGGVMDLSWEASGGDYVLSVSSDQTCRLWASVQAAVSEDSRQVWLELGRPQVHGYDLAAVTSISTKEHPHLMVTGADEKELRAFDAPTATLQLLQQVFGLAQDADSIARVDRAYIPSLGLSNKASAKDSAEEEKPDESENNIKENRLRLPFERDLGAVSLWPETRKLFGHTTELYCLTSTVAAQTARAFAGTAPLEVIVASSCKARDADAAAIRLWKVHEGKCHQVLSGGHKATVATLAFSPCGTYLASSGKDRRLCVWKRQPEGNFVLAWFRDNAHKRIIWSVHFCPWDPLCLVSGSRDGCIRVWRLSETEGTLQATVAHSFAPSFSMNGKPDAVTALSLRPTPYAEGVALLAVGLESGRSEFWSLPVAQVTPNDGVPALVRAVPEGLCHRATITKLAWKPEDEAQGGSTLLASSSMDHGVRVLQVTSV